MASEDWTPSCHLALVSVLLPDTRASFYYIIVPDANNLPPAFSSDYRLSKLQSFTYGVDITYQVFKHLSLDASYMRYVMEGLDGVTSQSAYPSANVFNAGLRVWF